jgi:hypothetical protein
MSELELSEQAKTWHRLTRLMMWTVGLVVTTLVLLALFLL